MLNLSSILKSFGLFVLLFGVLFALASTDGVEKKLGAWFISSSSTLFEWTMPQAKFFVEHDRDPKKFDYNEVWISPVDRKWFQETLLKTQQNGQKLEITNKSSILFKIGTFPKTSLIFLIALVLATPMALKKKAKKLLLGLLIFAVYFFLFVYCDIMHHIAINKIGVYELEGMALSILIGR